MAGKNNRYLIYALCEPNTCEVRYVGRSSSGLSRPFSHWKSKRQLAADDKCHAWVRHVLAAGQTPTVIILEEFEKSDDVNQKLNDREIFWISELKCAGYRLTNLTAGGGGLLNPSDSTREKLRATKLGNTWNIGRKCPDDVAAKIANTLRGIPLSEPRRTKISSSLKGKTPASHAKRMLAANEARRRAVICLNDSKEFRSSKEAAMYYNISTAHLSNVLHGKRAHTRGLRFKFLTESGRKE